MAFTLGKIFSKGGGGGGGGGREPGPRGGSRLFVKGGFSLRA